MHSNGTRDVLVVSRVVNLCASFSAHFWWLWGVKEHGKFKCKQKGKEKHHQLKDKIENIKKSSINTLTYNL